MQERLNALADTHQFQELLARYARLILELGVGLQRDEYLLISALTVHRDFAVVLAEEAYRRGASFVNVLFQDEKLQQAQLRYADEKSLAFIPKSMLTTYEEVLAQKGAFISISGREDLESFKGIDPARHGKALLARMGQLEFFYKKIQANGIKWCVAAAASPGPAAAVFPTKKPDEALHLLWDTIFRICKIHEKDALASWRKHIVLLEKRKRLLNELGIRRLTFTSPTCDLSIGLDHRAIWRGGLSETTEGESFLPNIPTEEVFTVPDYKSIDGSFTSSRPLTYKNIYVEKLTLLFRDGELVSLEGGEGIEELKEILKTDVAHRRVGEIALVDSRSAVARSGLVFHDLLYDENAESHLAIGSAYNECLRGFDELDESGCEGAGFNISPLHIDIMFGSPALSVSAVCADGKDRAILKKGLFLLD